VIRPGLRALLLLPVAALALSACAASSSGNGSAADNTGNTAATKSGGLLSDRQPAPVLSGPTIGGGSITTAAYKGSVVVVNFYASWCSPCIAETPLLEAAAKADPDVKFVGVLFKDSEANGAAFRRQYDVTYPSLVDTNGQDIVKFRNVSPSAVPVTFVIDKQGRVAARYVGGIGVNSGFTTVLDKLEAET
jgi:thiol-disulfide isomerase/thioredoxin